MSDLGSSLLADARRICAVPAPLHGEAARGQLVAQMFEEAGVTPRIDQTGNVIAWFGPTEEPAAVLAAHLDTVFPVETPIEFTEDGGRVSAPGFGDNSVGVAALVHLARFLRDIAVERAVALVATVGEEGLGDLRGAKALLEAIPCRAFVAVEGQMQDRITVIAVGSVRLRVRITGPGGHPWSDRDNPNAIHALLQRLSTAVRELSSPEVAINVNVIGGGTAINVIADSASAEIDLRCEDEQRLIAAADRLSEIVTAGLRRASDDPALTAEVAPTRDRVLTAEVERLGHRPGGRIAPDHPLLEAARRARSVAGLPPATEDASSTDANAAHGRGIPAITVGVSTGGNAHRLDDYVDVEPIAAGLRSLEELTRQLASDPGL